MATGTTHTSRTERALVTLRQRVLSGSLPGGTRLYEVALAEELDISRTPVRNALSKLAEEGLLDRGEKVGFIVRGFDVEEVIDTIEIRGALEGMAARLAAERGAEPRQLVGAREIVRKIDEIPISQNFEIHRYSALNSEFHDLLASMAKSAAVARELARIKSLPFAGPSAFLDDGGLTSQQQNYLPIAQDQHRMLIDAIEHREGARAEAIAREHARLACRNVRELMPRGIFSNSGASNPDG